MPDFSARFASAAEIASWDEHVTANPHGGNLLQSEAFAAVKKNYGWKPLYLVCESATYSSYNLVLEKSFPLLGKLWYLIKGPDAAGVEDVPAMLDAVTDFVRSARLNVFAVKIEPDIVDSEQARAILGGAGLVKTFNLQPNDSTAILDISPEENQLLRNLHSRGRNAVRRALREGVQVVAAEPTEANFRTMYALMSGTIAEKGTTQIRDYGYYSKFWAGFTARGQGRLYFVYEDGQASVGAFVINYGRKGTYKDGGSLQKRSQYGDSHLVQWTAINAVKALGATEYDFCGTPPSDRLKDPTHPHHGLGLFKTSFSKTVTDFVGCYDLVLGRLRYKLWTTVGERIFRQLYTRRTGQQFY
ncbi:peptidoglycan bridge formation glycyltransferase FemA/FemB family protein [Paenarthrobacter sp. Z7-10]|uniref:lipid II:glycine glycyltransferase FemX n=1 Tax=Paenarthrobacter sp. Z7-10 TaxID=2787635 RepID=UPI0022A99054|nr:peptidoglycan bridge formation glycyltransferase FemA/FemB family protein [Paenarthrobacter sp. Z7-10]MCZ2402575.1 peptidoglycan bridge formation glycyltransferase FemA/FemB family protein [Paenarthrobacter sp. Z7-10]